MPRQMTKIEKMEPVQRDDGTVIGYVWYGIFMKTLVEDEHKLRVPPAWATDVSSIKQAEKLGATEIEIRCKDTGRIYRTSTATFWDNAREMDRGHGLQMYLVDSFWTIMDPNQPGLPGLES